MIVVSLEALAGSGTCAEQCGRIRLKVGECAQRLEMFKEEGVVP